MTATKLAGHEALNRVLATELAADRRVLVMGETVRLGGSTRTVLRGLYDRFGPSQVIETPVSENGIFGAALGLALSGYRPIIEIYTADFLLVVANEIMGDIAKWRQQQALPGPLPIVIRGCTGHRRQARLARNIRRRWKPSFIMRRGSSSSRPARHAIWRAAAGLVRSRDPVIFLEHRRIYPVVGEVPDEETFSVPLEPRRDCSRGNGHYTRCLELDADRGRGAVRMLDHERISVELIDPRTIRPMDHETIARWLRAPVGFSWSRKEHRRAALPQKCCARRGERGGSDQHRADHNARRYSPL